MVFLDIDANERELVNEVTANIKTSKSEEEKTDEEETKLEIKGTVIAHYIDINGEKLVDDVTVLDLVGNDYITTAKNIDSYQLVEVKGDKNGQYIDGVLEITYVYTELGKGGDVEEMPPQTGVEDTINLFTILNGLILMIVLLFRK